MTMTTRLYQVHFEINGKEGSKGVRAGADATEEQILALFRATWEEYGDEFDGSCWVAESWVCA
jgi:hypothetical protein